jgi:2-C-methyl-D-erythritol 4-phosphate cytidylyltransferase
LKKYVLILAGGKGDRIKSEIPKQFITIAGKPVLMHTISQFYNYIHRIEIILILPSNYLKLWDELCKKYNFNIKHKIIKGGKTRFYSVKNGLSAINKNKESMVAVHDGVRPVLNKKTISKLFSYAEKYGNAVPCVTITDSIRKIIRLNQNNISIDRNNLRAIQTPQCFKLSILEKAYSQNYNKNFTDDANVVESIGEKIHLINGNIENIKITTPVDLLIAETLLNKKSIHQL